MKRLSTSIILIIFLIAVSCQQNKQTDNVKVEKKDSSLRELLPPSWYQKATALKISTLKKGRDYGHELSMNPDVFSLQMDTIKAQGFQAIEIFAPAEGLYAYSGLDTKNFYRIDPELGTMEDFRKLVRIAHSKGIAVEIFLNIGYISVEGPDWIEACRDKKAGKITEKVKWFLWSDKADTPRPKTLDDFNPYYVKEALDQEKANWGWQYSELAGCYFWARWKAEGKDESIIPLPQMDWGSNEWPKEAEKIVRVWMDTGIDGVVVDAPVCYANMTWAKNFKHITSVISSYGNVLIDPEGGKDPSWITEGKYNTMHDYGLNEENWLYGVAGYGHYGTDQLHAINKGNPFIIENSLRNYHDLMSNAGAVLLGFGPWKEGKEFSVKNYIHYALLVGIGDMVVMGKGQGNPDTEISRLFKMKSEHPALNSLASRRAFLLDSINNGYAFLKTSQDKSERIIAVYNFQSKPQTVQLDMSVIDMLGMVDLQTSEKLMRANEFTPVPVSLLAYGYRFFKVIAPEHEK